MRRHRPMGCNLTSINEQGLAILRCSVALILKLGQPVISSYKISSFVYHSVDWKESNAYMYRQSDFHNFCRCYSGVKIRQQNISVSLMARIYIQLSLLYLYTRRLTFIFLIFIGQTPSAASSCTNSVKTASHKVEMVHSVSTTVCEKRIRRSPRSSSWTWSLQETSFPMIRATAPPHRIVWGYSCLH